MDKGRDTGKGSSMGRNGIGRGSVDKGKESMG